MPKKNIVILGAGFGGITAALTIARDLGRYKDQYEIILIDRQHHHLYTPALYEIAAIPAEQASTEILKQSILIPLEDITAGYPITLIADEFIGFRPEEKKITLQRAGDLVYAFLVFALGSETNYFGIPGLAEHSFPLKTCDDALRLRAVLENIIKRRTSAEIVVGGGGSSGVEVAAEFINFFCAIREGIPDGARVCATRLTLVEAGPDILPGLDPWIVSGAKKRLQKLGITIRIGSRIQSITGKEIIYQDDTNSTYDILVWTGGVKGPAALARTSLPLSDKGTLPTDEYLQVAGGENAVFAVGDNAAVADRTSGRLVVWNVPAAQHEARAAAQNILALIRGGKKEKFIARKKYPFLLALGKKYAIADLGRIRSAGFWGWCVKQMAELRYLLFILPPGKAIRIWRLGMKMYMSND